MVLFWCPPNCSRAKSLRTTQTAGHCFKQIIWIFFGRHWLSFLEFLPLSQSLKDLGERVQWLSSSCCLLSAWWCCQLQTRKISKILLFVYISWKPTSRRIALTLTLFFARGIIAGLFQAAYVYTPEVYPTALRSIGVGGCSALARLGAMATPYVAQVLLQTSLWGAVSVYGVFAMLAAIACLLLPYETQGNNWINIWLDFIC